MHVNETTPQGFNRDKSKVMTAILKSQIYENTLITIKLNTKKRFRGDSMLLLSRSPNLTSLEFFRRGYVKLVFYNEDKPWMCTLKYSRSLVKVLIAPVTSVMVQPTWVAQVDHGTSVDAATNGTQGTVRVVE